MRTTTAAERGYVSALRLATQVRLEVEDPDGTRRDVSTSLNKVDWLNAVRVEDDIDRNTLSLSGSLLRDTSTLSLSPFRSDSLVNRNAAGAYAPMVDIWRKFWLSTSVMPIGSTPNWKELAQGRMDVIEIDGDKPEIRITGRGEEAVFLDCWIDQERTYGSAGGVAAETVLQQMLDDNLGTGRANVGSSGYTVITSVSPSYNMKTWTQTAGSLGAALAAVAEKPGYILRFRYNASNVRELQFFKPNRTASSEDWSLGPGEYTRIPFGRINIQDIRNLAKITYADDTAGRSVVYSPKNTGTLSCTAGAATFSVSQAAVILNGSVVVAHGVSGCFIVSAFNGTTGCTLTTVGGGSPTFTATNWGTSTSLTNYKKRVDIEMDLSRESQVTSSTGAQGFADAVVSDTQFPNLEQQIETLGFWFVQLWDYGKFLANAMYDVDQFGGVTSIIHEMAQGTLKTTLGARGKPAGRYNQWRRMAALTASPMSNPLSSLAQAIVKVTATTATTVTVTVTANPVVPAQQVQLVAITGSATLNSGTAIDTWVTPNGTNNIWVFNRGAINAGVGQAQFRVGNTSSSPNDDDFVGIEEQGRDTVYLIARAEVTAITATDITIRVRVADPFPASNVSVAYVNTGTGTVNLTSPQVISTGITSDVTTTNFVDFIVQRGTGTGSGRITFTATATARASDSDAVDIPPARVTGGGGTPTLSSPDSFWNGTNTVTGTDTAGRITFDKSTTSSSQHSGHQIKVTFAVAYPSVPFVLLGVPNKFTSNLHFEIGAVTATDFWIDANADVLLVNGVVAQQQFVSYAVIG